MIRRLAIVAGAKLKAPAQHRNFCLFRIVQVALRKARGEKATTFPRCDCQRGHSCCILLLSRPQIAPACPGQHPRELGICRWPDRKISGRRQKKSCNGSAELAEPVGVLSTRAFEAESSRGSRVVVSALQHTDIKVQGDSSGPISLVIQPEPGMMMMEVPGESHQQLMSMVISCPSVCLLVSPLPHSSSEPIPRFSSLLSRSCQLNSQSVPLAQLDCLPKLVLHKGCICGRSQRCQNREILVTVIKTRCFPPLLFVALGMHPSQEPGKTDFSHLNHGVGVVLPEFQVFWSQPRMDWFLLLVMSRILLMRLFNWSRLLPPPHARRAALYRVLYARASSNHAPAAAETVSTAL